MLTAGELAAMRTTAGAALLDTAVIQTQTWVSDSGGGGSQTWTTSGTVDCRLAPIRGDERELGGRISPDADSIVTLPYDATVTTNSRLIISGGTYAVAHVRDRSWELTTRVEVTKETS